MRIARRLLRPFLKEEDGAVTVDWVALTAAILMLGLFAGFSVTSSVPTLANKLSEFVSGRSVGPE
ncbi:MULTISPECIES: hypothetical protein [Maritimibacter]|jgi:Flp pilus assembly pilin Flp|uniref:Uncharacterized protein n=1 Tax=Maritimibacter alkaliphilus HTCC2654 TaxID=314271 RepID=A3VMA5_9RHOB|nr:MULTISPECIES: hypothetical protein [Maritimibacter]EAQ10622.1 hypothetical protein RB2654_07965 [Rhodobacterales bacterium HTCC2654] [Maritimibacter alkaliphilus HTCC2654]MBL6428808.1 hypothetical protein [Maritimibacter sp.]TYP85580.1 hypothetical protein BD830_101543 [Maritimibacter alkaliphilus HTCC2654]